MKRKENKFNFKIKIDKIRKRSENSRENELNNSFLSSSSGHEKAKTPQIYKNAKFFIFENENDEYEKKT